MIKKNLHILFALLLVATTTASIWSHLLTDDGDPIEVSTETENEKGEKELKESEKELDRFDGDLASSDYGFIPELSSGLLKVGSSSFAPVSENHLGYYILYRSLKLDC